MRIEIGEPVLQQFDLRRRREVGLCDDQTVGEDDLLSRLDRPLQRILRRYRVDERNRRLDVKLAAERTVGGEGLQDRPRVGEA
jgi:hypothetical protein